MSESSEEEGKTMKNSEEENDNDDDEEEVAEYHDDDDNEEEEEVAEYDDDNEEEEVAEYEDDDDNEEEEEVAEYEDDDDNEEEEVAEYDDADDDDDDDDEEEEEEENPSVDAAADTEVSDELVVLSSAEEDDDPPPKKLKYLHLIEDCVTPESKSRQSSRQDNKEADQSSSIRPHSIIAKFSKENFLFEVQLSRSDYESKTLTIPRETVEKHFSAAAAADTGIQLEINVSFYGKYNEQYPVTKLLIPPQPGAHLVVITGWSQFFGAQNLKAMDLIRFYKPLLEPSHNQHYYLLDSLKHFFMKKIVATDITEKKLHIPKSVAEDHFPALNTSTKCHAEIQISDAENETCDVKFQVYPKSGKNSDAYKINWKRFVLKHKLKVDDEIHFYKPARPMKGNRYAIRFEKAQREQT